MPVGNKSSGTAPRMFAVITDADNTLWDTDRLYADTQLWLLSSIEEITKKSCLESNRLDYVRDLDQALAQQHHLGLRYPVVLLANAIAWKLLGHSRRTALQMAIENRVSAVEEKAVQDLADQVKLRLASFPSLRVGVDIGLARLRHLGVSIVVATEGSVDLCKSRLEHWGLRGYVDHIMSAPKTTELFTRIANLVRLPTSKCFAVGDQLDRDIAPALAAGYQTIYFPGGFKPVWAPEPEHVLSNYIISSFDEIPKILENDFRVSSTNP